MNIADATEHKELIEYIQGMWDEEEAMALALDLDNLGNLSAFKSHEINMIKLEAIKGELERLKDIPCKRYVAADRVCESVAELQKQNEGLEERIKELEGKQMILRNGDIVSEMEYYRLRFPKMVKAAKEATRLLNETKV